MFLRREARESRSKAVGVGALPLGVFSKSHSVCAEAERGCCVSNTPALALAHLPASRATTGLSPIQPGQPFGFSEIVHCIGVEERIERLMRPCDGRKSVTRGEAVDLSYVFDDERVAKLLA
jgi:hypothetical protein